jgi:hypothetical protein
MTKGHVLVRSPIRLVPKFLLVNMKASEHKDLLKGGGRGWGGVGEWGWGKQRVYNVTQ